MATEDRCLQRADAVLVDDLATVARLADRGVAADRIVLAGSGGDGTGDPLAAVRARVLSGPRADGRP